MKALFLLVLLSGCSTTGVSQYDAILKRGDYVTYADNTLTVKSSYGGQVDAFRNAAIMIGARGDKLVIDGRCLSACTYMVDTTVADVCVTKHAYFGYHLFRNDDGHYYPKDYYSKAVYNWVAKHGGWHGDRFTFMSGGQLLKFYKACE